MSINLLRTKLFVPPLRPSLVHRPDLIKRLNKGMQQGCKLTLISAPAGFGKTTLMSAWAQQCEQPAAWLSLDESDNDVTHFLTYLAATLQTIDGNIGKELLTTLQSAGTVNIESFLTTLLNEISELPNDVILILDDYHVIESRPIDKAIIFLLDHLPSCMHLVIVSRIDPSLPLSRLRASGHLTELRAVDLRFSSTEAAEFLNQVMGLELAVEDITALETRTEGWIAGLQLAALSLQGHEDTATLIKSFTGSHRFVLDYIIEEVLEQQPEDIQNFLLQTAVLDRMTGSLCDALMGQNTGQMTLERLEHANLFIIPLDDDRQWYRYHHLFADLLRQRQRQVLPEETAVLHHKASQWYEQNGFTDESIEHALRAQDFGRATKLIERIAEAVWARGISSKLQRWLTKLPVEFLCAKPQLCIFHAWYLIGSGDQDTANRILQAAEQKLATYTDEDIENKSPEQEQHQHLGSATLRGRLATTQAFAAFYRGDILAIIQQARQALEYLPAQNLSWRSTALHLLGDAYDFSGEMEVAYHSRLKAVEASRASGNNISIMIANLKLAIVLRHQGRLQQVIEICRQQLEFANENGMAQSVVVGWLLAIWGEVLAEINGLDAAKQQAKRGVALTERGGDLAMLGWSYICLIRILFSCGELATAAEIVHKMENIARESDMLPLFMNLTSAWQVRLWLAQGKLEAVAQWVDARGLDADRRPTYLHEMEYMVLARFLIIQRRLNEASKLLQNLLEATKAGGRISRMIEVLLLQAMLLQDSGDTNRAITALDQALRLAEPGGFVRVFIDEGLPMAQLLSKTADLGIMPDYTGKLLAAFKAEAQAGESASYSPPIPPAQSQLELLSQRELEVLHLIAQGCSNREVSKRLYLALNTVKGHNSRIFGKLGVKNRTQAINKAIALKLIPHPILTG